MSGHGTEALFALDGNKISFGTNPTTFNLGQSN